jgi:hypothetical protein
MASSLRFVVRLLSVLLFILLVIFLYRQTIRYSKDLTQAIKPFITQTSPDQLFTKINQYRQSLNLSPLVSDTSICPQSASPSANACPSCTHAIYLTVTKYAPANQVMNRLIEEPSVNQTLTNPQINSVCITTREDNLSLLLASRVTVKGSATKTAAITRQHLQPKPTSAPTTLTEDQLWQALVIYREAQKRSSLSRDDKFCTYARKRVQDQISMMQTVKQADYPNQEKYPLDAHQGFIKDADSGYAFDVTGANHLAENLAYYPNAQTATQIIEWGWDTSTEGHREAQLSNDWTKACLSGADGFYVAIFGS